MNEPRTVALVVDDEALVRTLLADLLEDNGFALIEAASGEEALAVLESRATEIALVYSDIRMPGMSGFDLLRVVERRWPHVRLVLTSGDHRLRDDEVPDHGVLVPKPSAPDQVLSAVRRAMA